MSIPKCLTSCLSWCLIMICSLTDLTLSERVDPSCYSVPSELRIRPKTCDPSRRRLSSW